MPPRSPWPRAPRTTGSPSSALSEGQSLLITGIGGGVGVAAAQLARDLGVFVIGTGSPHKQELAESLGATLVAYGDGAGDSVPDRVRAIMPDGVDAIFDLVGGDALRAVAGLVKDGSSIISAADPGTAHELGGRAVERTSAPPGCSPRSPGSWPTANWTPTSRTSCRSSGPAMRCMPSNPATPGARWSSR